MPQEETEQRVIVSQGRRDFKVLAYPFKDRSGAEIEIDVCVEGMGPDGEASGWFKIEDGLSISFERLDGFLEAMEAVLRISKNVAP